MKRVLRVGLGVGLFLAASVGALGAQPPAAAPAPRFLTAPGMDLTCYPARLLAEEGRWTFLLRGHATLGIEGAALELKGVRTPAERILYPTPNAAVIDVKYARASDLGTATLILFGQTKEKEIARFTIRVDSWPEPPTERRQIGLVRLQLKPWTLLYPLHDSEVKERTLPELAGDAQFLTVLQDLGITAVRKAIARYAEDDSLHWNPQFQREDALGGDVLRTYLLVVDRGHSEVAVKEIMLAFPQVQKAFVNQDLSK
jgi:hypothetical protein